MRLAGLLVVVAVMVTVPAVTARAQDDAGPSGTSDAGVAPAEPEPEPQTEPEAEPEPTPEPQEEPEATEPPLCAMELGEHTIDHPLSPYANGATIAGFKLRGELLDSESELRAVLEPLLAVGAAYTPGREACLLARLDRLRYVVEISGKD